MEYFEMLLSEPTKRQRKKCSSFRSFPAKIKTNNNNINTAITNK